MIIVHRECPMWTEYYVKAQQWLCNTSCKNASSWTITTDCKTFITVLWGGDSYKQQLCSHLKMPPLTPPRICPYLGSFPTSGQCHDLTGFWSWFFFPSAVNLFCNFKLFSSHNGPRSLHKMDMFLAQNTFSLVNRHATSASYYIFLGEVIFSVT